MTLMIMKNFETFLEKINKIPWSSMLQEQSLKFLAESEKKIIFPQKMAACFHLPSLWFTQESEKNVTFLKKEGVEVQGGAINSHT